MINFPGIITPKSSVSKREKLRDAGTPKEIYEYVVHRMLLFERDKKIAR